MLPPIEEILSSKGRVKLLIALARHKELSITEIAEILHLNPRDHVDALLCYDIIKERKPNKKGMRRIKRLYSLNEDHIFVSAFLDFYNTIQKTG